MFTTDYDDILAHEAYLERICSVRDYAPIEEVLLAGFQQ